MKETIIVFYYVLQSGARCFFMQPAPNVSDAQPMQAKVELCSPAKEKKYRCTGVNDTIPINGTDTVYYGRIIDFQE